MNPVQSGREWIQHLQMTLSSTVSVGLFFDALKSRRRLRLLEEVNRSIVEELKATVAYGAGDPLSAMSSLDHYAVYASDGHYEAAASHTKALFGKIRPPQCFFAMNLRTQGLSLLDIARPAAFKKKEHDIKALKRLGSTVLRMGEKKGIKVIHVYDPAVVDYHAGAKWKAKGVYILTREKENSAADIQGCLSWDHSAPENVGVVSDHLVGTSAGYLLRRIVYADSAAGTKYTFLTNVLDVPPGVLAFLYKRR